MKLQKIKNLTENKLFSILLDILIVIGLMALSVSFRLPTLDLGSTFIDYREEYRGETGVPYLHDPDSYYYARKTREVLETGDYSLISKNTNETLRVNTMEGIDRRFFPVSMAVLYRVINFFHDLPFESFLSLIGPFVYSLAIIPVYIFVKKRSKTRFGAIIAGFFIGLAPAFFGKSTFICYDTDLLLCVLPLCFVCSFLDSLTTPGKKQYIYVALSVLSFVALTLTWGAYGPYYYLLAGSFIFIFLLNLLRNSHRKLSFEKKSISSPSFLKKYKFIKPTFKKRENRQSFKSIISRQDIRNSFIILVLCTIFCFVAFGGVDVSVIDTAVDILGLKPESTSNYPSASVFVNELRKIGFFPELSSYLSATSYSIAGRLGGVGALILGIILLIFILVRSLTRYQKYLPESFILFFWIIATLFASTAAERFVEFAMLPWALILGIGISFASEFLHSRFFQPALVCLVLALVVSPFTRIRTFCRLTPSANDALFEVASFIREDKGNEDALAFSWWDLGYIYEYEGRIRAFADGGTYNGELYVYLARALMTDDWKEAESLIRSQIQKYNLDSKKVYYIVTRDMTDITGAISYYANWETDKEEGKKYDYDTSLMRKFYENSENVGNFKFAKYVKDPTGAFNAAVYTLDID